MTTLPTILEQIVKTKQAEIEALYHDGVPRSSPRDRLKRFLTAIQKPSLSIIAEVKKASPSRGVIRGQFNPVAISRQFAQQGAAALSVLTDPTYFQGHPDFIRDIRAECPLPILRKEFILDDIQLHETCQLGADAVLLIAAILSDHQLYDLHHKAHELGLDVLVEVHTEAELQRVLTVPNIEMIGINNRNLHTFSVDLNVSLRLRSQIPDGKLVVAESGYRTTEELIQLLNHGFDGVLIGEGLAYLSLNDLFPSR